MKRHLTLLRRVVQTLCFLVILYGAFVWPHHIETLRRIEPGTPRTTQYDRNRILWVSGKESVFDLYLPVLACRFVAKGGLFRSCSLHLLSENITWRTSLKTLLPNLLFTAALMFLFARAWCGWVCPLGSVTDVLTFLRTLTGRARTNVSIDWSRFFAKSRQFLLFLTLIISAAIAFPVFGRSGVNDALFLFYCQLCPARLLYPPLGAVNPCWYDSTSSLTMFMTVVGWLSFALFFVGLFVPRLWCRICAVGALVSYFNRGGLTSLEKKAGKCTFCGSCHRCCPVDIQRVYHERERRNVTDSECLLCLRCVQECPEEDCLEAKFAGKTLVVS